MCAGAYVHAGRVTPTAGPAGLLHQLDAYMELACGDDYNSWTPTLKNYTGEIRSFLLDTSSSPPDDYWPPVPETLLYCPYPPLVTFMGVTGTLSMFDLVYKSTAALTVLHVHSVTFQELSVSNECAAHPARVVRAALSLTVTAVHIGTPRAVTRQFGPAAAAYIETPLARGVPARAST